MVCVILQHGCYGVSLVTALRHTAVWWLWNLVGELLCIVVSAASATIELLGLVWLFQQVSGRVYKVTS